MKLTSEQLAQAADEFEQGPTEAELDASAMHIGTGALDLIPAYLLKQIQAKAAESNISELQVLKNAIEAYV